MMCSVLYVFVDVKFVGVVLLLGWYGIGNGMIFKVVWFVVLYKKVDFV